MALNSTQFEIEINKTVIKAAKTKIIEWERNLPIFPYAKGALFERTQPTVAFGDAETFGSAVPRSTATFDMPHSCSTEGLAAKIQESNTKQNTTTMAFSQAQEQSLLPDEESLYPLDSRYVSYILIKVEDLELYDDSYYQLGDYRFCNPLGCGLESDASVQDKRPYVALALTFDRDKLKGPILRKMNNAFVPEKKSEMEVFPGPVPQEHAFARVLVNPQYAFKDLKDSLNNFLNANTLETQYFMEECNNFSKAVQNPLCFNGTFKKT